MYKERGPLPSPRPAPSFWAAGGITQKKNSTAIDLAAVTCHDLRRMAAGWLGATVLPWRRGAREFLSVFSAVLFDERKRGEVDAISPRPPVDSSGRLLTGDADAVRPSADRSLASGIGRPR